MTQLNNFNQPYLPQQVDSTTSEDAIQMVTIKTYQPEAIKFKSFLTVAKLQEFTQPSEVDLNPIRGLEVIETELREKYLPKLEKFKAQLLQHNFPETGRIRIHLTHPQKLSKIWRELHARAEDNLKYSNSAGYCLEIEYESVITVKEQISEFLNTDSL